jgi:ADP-heptose:LPS heptosyltransferase
VGELAEAISGAALVLAVDTFAAHLAVSFDAPTVSLIGGGQYGDFGPWQRSTRQRWVTNRVPCFGCGWQCTRSRVECLVDITPGQVLKEAEEILQLDSNHSVRLSS